MGDLIKVASANFPNIVLLTFFILALYVILKEYTKLQEGIEKKVAEVVSARIGEILSSLQIEIDKAERFSKSQKEKLDEISSTHDVLISEIFEKHQYAIVQFKDIELKFAELIISIPDVENYSADDLLALARRSDSFKSAQFCKKILEHEDASSRVLEYAGDIMRKSSRYSLAQELYERAYSNDPDRGSAYIEYIALSAEMNHKDRENLLEQGINFVLASPQINGFLRIANLLIILNRHKELLGFAERFYAIFKGNNPELESAALRNIGIAHDNLRNTTEAEKFFLESYNLTPNDENSVKVYSNILKDSGKIDEYIALRKKLITMDPIDLNYYIILIRELLKNGKYQEAEDWLTAAADVALSHADKLSLEEYRFKIDAGLRVGKLVT